VPGVTFLNLSIVHVFSSHLHYSYFHIVVVSGLEFVGFVKVLCIPFLYVIMIQGLEFVKVFAFWLL
jgi:hypothetical protein